MGNISVYRITIAQYEYRCITNLSLFRHRLKKGHLAKEKLYFEMEPRNWKIAKYTIQFLILIK